MELHDLRPAEGANKKRKRVGRGTGSGKGKTSTRGTKGQLARNGSGIHGAFEGGQIRMTKRLPKLRGFTNRFKVDYVPVNLDAIERHYDAGTEVTPETLKSVGLVGDVNAPIVLLGRGEITRAVTVKVHRVSESARAKIVAAGGAVELTPWVVNKNLPRS